MRRGRGRRMRPQVLWLPGNVAGAGGYGSDNQPFTINGGQNYYSGGHIAVVDLLPGETTGTPDNRLAMATGGLLIERIVGQASWMETKGPTDNPYIVDVLEWITTLDETHQSDFATIGDTGGTLAPPQMARTDWASVTTALGNIWWAHRWSYLSETGGTTVGVNGNQEWCTGALPFGEAVDIHPRRHLRNDQRLVLCAAVGVTSVVAGSPSSWVASLQTIHTFTPRLRVLARRTSMKRR